MVTGCHSGTNNIVPGASPCIFLQHIDEFKDVDLDYVVTVCGHADENCPAFGGATKVVHVGFDDPPKLAKEAASEQEALDCYRQVRDEIKVFVEKLLKLLICKIF